MFQIKTVIFLSNYFNHHQKPFSDSMYRKLGSGYKFVATEKMDEERRNMGWKMDEIPEYVCEAISDQQIQSVQNSINNADVVIIGSAPYSFVKTRIQNHKVVFYYSERIMKSHYEYWKIPVRIIKSGWKNKWYRNTYMLCAGAYAAADYGKLFAYLNHTYKWGYFPEKKTYDNIDALISSKEEHSLLWVGRMLDWKHPEIAIEVARRLRDEGYCFELNLIGNGILEDKIQEYVQAYNLGQYVHILGAMKPEEVRRYMERSEIFLFTSDRNEGWGAVLNESMNSACVVVANHMIGSVPFLIEDNQNGYVYNDGNIDELYAKVIRIMHNSEKRRKIAKNAYQTIACEWNADVATDHFLQLSKAVLNGCQKPGIFEQGVCSEAKRIKDNWY